MTGLSAYEPEEADGQLQFEIHSEDELKLFAELQQALLAHRKAEDAGEAEADL
eukprot:m.267895 g.267895  ORF g.267895 m.267895 type:complete len:53 (+) comp15646_c0_seq3:212-370(+)